MASCTKCGANLVTQARFCASCGSPVANSSIAPAPAAPRPLPVSVPDAFARTMLSDEAMPVLPDAPPAAVSPMAASVMASQSQPPPARGSAIPAAASPRPYAGGLPTPAPPVPAQPAPQPPPQYPQPAAPPLPPFVQGSMVLVYWADGNRYPGTVLQVAQHHVMVAFPNGTQQWIDARYVQAGR